ncbi:MAG: GIY-YIG nuclease family protein [Candidatus Binataceae bacterium]
MATLPGQRAQFTWALHQYNLAQGPEQKAHFAKRMARYITAAPACGFTVEDVTQGQDYPAADVSQYLNAPEDSAPETEISEGQALEDISQAVDASDVVRLGEGPEFVYAYGYQCAPDRLKIGLTKVDPVQRIVAQISTGTPDRPVLFLEIRTHDCGSLERAIHSILEYRGCKVVGGGDEWFKAKRENVTAIYEFIINSHA